MERPELADDPRFAANRDRVAHMDLVDDMVASYTVDQLKAPLAQTLQAHRVPCAPVRDLTEVMEDPVLLERGALVEVDHPAFGPIRLPRSSLRFEGTPQAEYQASPDYGESNARIYGDLGLSEAEIKSLVDKKVI